MTTPVSSVCHHSHLFFFPIIMVRSYEQKASIVPTLSVLLHVAQDADILAVIDAVGSCCRQQGCVLLVVSSGWHRPPGAGLGIEPGRVGQAKCGNGRVCEAMSMAKRGVEEMMDVWCRQDGKGRGMVEVS